MCFVLFVLLFLGCVDPRETHSQAGVNLTVSVGAVQFATASLPAPRVVKQNRDT